MTRIDRLDHAGLRFDVRDRGPEDGTAVVLLHGFPQRAECWAGVEERLAAAGLRTFALDQRGYSPGARPTGRTAYRSDHVAGDAVALIDRVRREGPSRPVHLVGHDWGANVAWSVAAAYPDRIASLTALSVPHPRALIRAMRSLDQARRSWYIAAVQVPWLPERLLAGRFGESLLVRSGMSPAMLAAYRRGIVEDGALPGALNWYRALPVRGAPRGMGRRVTVPTTYVWSDQDVALGRRGAELCRSFVTGDYRFVELEGASHWLLDERPDDVAEAIIARVGSA